MVVKLYALLVFHGDKFETGSDSTTILDFDDLVSLKAQVNGHLEGFLRRNGVKRDVWHEYALDVLPADREGKSTGAARIFRWYLPYASEVTS